MFSNSVVGLNEGCIFQKIELSVFNILEGLFTDSEQLELGYNTMMEIGSAYVKSVELQTKKIFIAVDKVLTTCQFGKVFSFSLAVIKKFGPQCTKSTCPYF